MTFPRYRILSVALAITVASAAFGQHMDQLRARTDAGFDAARLATRNSFEALAGYPKDVRDAILTLSTRPELIVKLNEARLTGNSSVDSIVAPLGPDMVTAARVISARPDVLQVLVERLPVVALIGQCAGDQMPTIKAILDRESETQAAAARALVDAWRKRVSAKPIVTQQLRDAAADFTASQSALQPIGADVVSLPDHPADASGMDTAHGSDWTAALAERIVKPLPADPSGVSGRFGNAAAGGVVSGLPGRDEVYFTLVHSDKYPDLAAAIIEQWYFEPNPDSYRSAVDEWYTTYQDTLPQTLGAQGSYLPAILKERVQFEKRYLAAMRDPATPRMYRSQFLEAHLKDFPALQRVRDNEIIARLNDTPDRVSGGPVSKSTRSGSGGGRSSSGQSSTSSMNRGGGRSSSGRSSAVGDITGGVGSSRNSRGNGSNSRFGNSGNGSGRGNFGSSNNSRGGFGNSGGGFGGGGSGFGSGGSGFGSGGSGFGSGGSGFGSSRSSGSRFGNSGSSRFGNSGSNFDN